MYEASAAFWAAMDLAPCQVLAGDLVLDEAELTAQWCASTFSLGNACAAGFTAKVTADRPPFARGDWVDLAVLAEETSVPLGRFQLTQVSAVTDEGCFTLTGTDAMGTLLEEAFVGETASLPALELFQTIARRCGLETAGEDLIPEAELLLGGDKSMRTLVGEIALLAGANAWIDRTGVLRLSRLTAADWALDPERYYESELELEEGDYVFGALAVSDGTTAYSAQMDGAGRGLSFQCESYSQAAFDAVWEAWRGVTFRPGSVSFLGNVLLDPGDLIAVTDRAGREYILPVLELKHRFDGGVRTAVTARVSEEEAAAVQNVSQAIGGLKLELGRFRRLYADDLSAVGAEIEHLNAQVVKARTILVTDDEGAVILKADAETGELTATSGTIGSLTLKDGKLTGTFTKTYPEFTQEDVTKIQQYAIHTITLTEEELERYDVNMDGRVTSLDALAIQKMIEGLNPNYSTYQFTIDAADPQACVTVEVTEGYHAGWKTTIGMGNVKTRNAVISDSLILGDSSMADFVVEQGADGIWRYEKWNSGKAVCWGKKSYGNQTLSAWGSCYETTNGVMGEEPYPFEFVDVPVCITQILSTEHGAWLETTSANSSSVDLTKVTTAVALVRPNNTVGIIGSPTLSFYAVGRWK